jgi:hypothetical protein
VGKCAAQYRSVNFSVQHKGVGGRLKNLSSEKEEGLFFFFFDGSPKAGV